jgi:hypothetical protein
VRQGAQQQQKLMMRSCFFLSFSRFGSSERRMLKVKKKEKGKLVQSEARLSIKANDLVGIIGDGPLLMPLFKMYTVVDVKEKLLHMERHSDNELSA